MITIKLQSLVVAAFLLLAGSTYADIIHDLTAQIEMQPVTLTLDSPDAATNVGGGMVHVVGSHNGRAALQILNLNTQTTGSIQYFDSLASAAGGTGNNSGAIREVRRLNSGQIIYVGDSAGSHSTIQPTSWLTPNNPQGGVGPIGTQVSGSYTGVSEHGDIIGFTNNALYGIHGNLPQFLPGGDPADVAVGITNDGNFIAGSFLWNSNTLGGYDVFNTSEFDFTTSGGTPTWQGVAIDPVTGKAVFAGEYLNLADFSTQTAFWNEDGNFLFSAGTNSNFTDFEVYNGELVAAVNGIDDFSLFAITDGSSLLGESILGSKSLLSDDGLFTGSVGFLSNNASGTIFAATATAVPEPSSFVIFAVLSGGYLIFHRKRAKA